VYIENQIIDINLLWPFGLVCPYFATTPLLAEQLVGCQNQQTHNLIGKSKEYYTLSTNPRVLLVE